MTDERRTVGYDILTDHVRVHWQAESGAMMMKDAARLPRDPRLLELIAHCAEKAAEELRTDPGFGAVEP